jgi:hypothetical protein
MAKPVSMHWLNGFIAAIMTTRQSEVFQAA